MNLVDYSRWFKEPTPDLHEKVGNEVPFVVRPLDRVAPEIIIGKMNVETYPTIPYYLMLPEAARGIHRVAMDAKSAVLAAYVGTNSIDFFDSRFVSISKRINPVAEVLDFAFVPDVMGFAPAIMGVTNGEEMMRVTKKPGEFFAIETFPTGENKLPDDRIVLAPHCECTSIFWHGPEPYKPAYYIKVEWDAARDAMDVWCRRHNIALGHDGPAPVIG